MPILFPRIDSISVLSLMFSHTIQIQFIILVLHLTTETNYGCPRPSLELSASLIIMFYCPLVTKCVCLCTRDNVNVCSDGTWMYSGRHVKTRKKVAEMVA